MNGLFTQITAAVRRHPLAVLVLVLLGVLGVANYVLWQERESVARRHDEAQRKGEAMLLALTNYARITSDLATVRDAQQRIDRNLVSERSMAKNLGYFFEMETLSHVRIGQLNQVVSQPSPEGNPFRAIPFSLRATGSYSQIMRFLRELETGPRLLRIRAFSFVRGEAQNNALSLELTVELLGLP